MVSPHLSIYKIRWATASSGCHRLTGFGLWLGTLWNFLVLISRFLGRRSCCTLWLQYPCSYGNDQVSSYYFIRRKVLYVVCSCLSLYLWSETYCRHKNWSIISSSSITILISSLGRTFRAALSGSSLESLLSHCS